MHAEKPYTFRPYVENDIPFIHETWRKNYYKGANYSKHLSPQEFDAAHRPIRNNILLKRDATIIVAASKEDPDVIIGWIAVQKPLQSKGMFLHYLYVKEEFRRLGIGSELVKRAIPDEPVMFTHMTRKISFIRNMSPEKFMNFHFFPHLI